MKNKILLSLLAVFATASIAAQSSFNVKLNVKKIAGPVKAYIKYQEYVKSIDSFRTMQPKNYNAYMLRKNTVIDSASAVNGILEFKGRTKNAPVLAEITFNAKGNAALKDKKIEIFISSEKLNITVDSNDFSKINLNGSQINEDYHAYKNMLGEVNAKIQSVPKKVMGKEITMQEGMLMVEGYNSEKEALMKAFIKQHPDSYVSLFALDEMTSYLVFDASLISPLYKSLSDKYKNSTLIGVKIGRMIDIYSGIAIGGKVPNFTVDNPEGQKISLDDFKGKYVLLDFWASWCGPCRAENPNYKKAYEKYKDKGFEILGISLDNVKAKWINAIKEDALPWPQVSDLKGVTDTELGSKFTVIAIPQNFLLDPNGVVIAKNIKGATLHKVLEEHIAGSKN